MPFRNEYFPPPTSPDLTVYAELPPDFVEERVFLSGTREAMARNPYRKMYHCRKCGGWIDGTPEGYREDTIGPLCGRRGTAYHCLRCGTELAFMGMVS